MHDIDYFKEFSKKHGRSLRDLNPGSEEYALSCGDALVAVDLIREMKIPIHGGDVLSERTGYLIYAHQAWGAKFQSLSWYCRKEKDETFSAYLNRSYDLARNRIVKAQAVAKELAEPCFVVLVI